MPRAEAPGAKAYPYLTSPYVMAITNDRDSRLAMDAGLSAVMPVRFARPPTVR